MRMEDQGLANIESAPKISVVFATEEMQKPAMNLASKLRQNLIPVDVDVLGRNLKKQMEQASDSKFAIIVGPKEFLENEVVLRNMIDGTENKIHITNLLSDPKSILGL